jgi:rubrerythrin
MNVFTASDIFEFAIRIEEDGELFYHRSANFADTEDIRRLFNQLADEEIHHKRIFTEMLEKINDIRPPETYPGEFMNYLRDYIDGKIIFSMDMKTMADDIHDTISALKFAMGRELESIAYYHEIKSFVSEKHHSQVDAIIQEERKHFTKLSEVLKNYRSKS